MQTVSQLTGEAVVEITPAPVEPTVTSEDPIKVTVTTDRGFSKEIEVSGAEEILFNPEAVASGEDIRSNPIPNISFRLLKEYAEVTLEGGIKKLIGHETLLTILQSALGEASKKEEVLNAQGMLMPSNVFYFSISNNYMELNMYHPACIKTMLYMDNKMTITVPNVIISMRLRKETASKKDSDWLVEKTYFFCTDLPVSKLPRRMINAVSHSDGIYLFPFTNTYPEGVMCYGSNQPPMRFKPDNLRAVDWYYKFLWEGSFNDDLGVRAVNSRRHEVSPRRWYKTLEKAATLGKTFPYPDLAGYQKRDGSPVSEAMYTADE